MRIIFILLTSIFLTSCQSQRFNIEEKNNVIIPTDIVTVIFSPSAGIRNMSFYRKLVKSFK